MAHERVVRGEDLSHARVTRIVLELPLRLQPWEPSYAVAAYRADKADFPEPDLPRPRDRTGPAATGETTDDVPAAEALYELVRPWVEESNGRAATACVIGEAASAAAALAPAAQVRRAELSPRQALAAMAWVGASGGAHGRRRGSPVGRYNAWWVGAALTELAWPPDETRLGEALGRLRWYSWDPGDVTSGWSCHLAVEDPARGLAWAIAARDELVSSPKGA